jgi:hypothetical protein
MLLVDTVIGSAQWPQFKELLGKIRLSDTLVVAKFD